MRGRRTRRVTGVLAASALALTGVAACSGDDGQVVVNLYGGTSAAGFEDIIAACNERADGAYRIEGRLLPSDADGQREQLVRRLAAGDDGMDLIGMDVTWTAEFAEAGWIEPVPEAVAAEGTEDTLQPTIDTAMWDGTLYGLPKHTNVQLLWYRKSLVPDPPTTWQEMYDQAAELKEAGEPYQIGFTGARYEGLVVGFNTILASAGGTLLNEESTEPTVDERTVEALGILRDLASSGVASRSLSNSQEPEVFADLQAGRAAFAINWPYVLGAMRTAGESDPDSAAIADDLGWAVLPSTSEDAEPRATLGGMNFAVSSHSEHQDEAWEAALCLRDRDHQLAHAKVAGEPPTLESLYQEPEFQEVFPQWEEMLAELEQAVPRPVTPLYQNISTIVSSTLSPPSAIDPEQTARTLEQEIQDAIDGKGILP